MINPSKLTFEQLNEAIAKRMELSTIESMVEREQAKTFNEAFAEEFGSEYERDQIADARTTAQALGMML